MIDRLSAFESFDQGKTPNELYKAGDVTKSNAYKWHKAWKRDRNVVQEVLEPPAVKAATDAPSKKSSKGITEKTAGMLLQVLFFMYGNIKHEELWYLTDQQRDQLAAPFRETMKTFIPAPIAAALDEYSPPIAFTVQLFSVIGEKKDLIDKKRASQYDPLKSRVDPVDPVDPEFGERPHSNGSGAVVGADPKLSQGTIEPEDVSSILRPAI
jgi:hypothetical protein